MAPTASGASIILIEILGPTASGSCLLRKLSSLCCAWECGNKHPGTPPPPVKVEAEYNFHMDATDLQARTSTYFGSCIIPMAERSAVRIVRASFVAVKFQKRQLWTVRF